MAESAADLFRLAGAASSSPSVASANFSPYEVCVMSRLTIWIALIAVALGALYLLQSRGLIAF
jgi:hypothetical protein